MRQANDSSESVEEAALNRERFPPVSVIMGCLLGCLLPVIAYAEAMSAIFGFSAIRRKWAWLLLIVPTTVWLGLAVRISRHSTATLSAHLSGLVVLLAGQLLIAVVVAAIIARVLAKRQAKQ